MIDNHQKESFYKYSFILLCFSLFISSCGTSRRTAAKTEDNNTSQNAVLDYGMKYLNSPYRYAGKGPNAFDCSGFTSFVFRKFGYNLNSSSAGQAKQFPKVYKKDLQPGDLVYFEGRRHNGKVGHVGIVKDIKSNGEFTFLHASNGNGVIVSSSTEDYYASRYLNGGRVIKEQTYATKTPVKKEVIRQEAQNKPPKDVKAPVVVKTNNTQTTDIQKEEIHTRQAKPIPANPLPQTPDVPKTKVGVITNSLSEEMEAVANQPDTIFHTVKKGDTLYSISKTYNCTVDEIRLWNPQLDNVLSIGKTLSIKKQ